MEGDLNDVCGKNRAAPECPWVDAAGGVFLISEVVLDAPTDSAAEIELM